MDNIPVTFVHFYFIILQYSTGFQNIQPTIFRFFHSIILLFIIKARSPWMDTKSACTRMCTYMRAATCMSKQHAVRIANTGRIVRACNAKHQKRVRQIHFFCFTRFIFYFFNLSLNLCLQIGHEMISCSFKHRSTVKRTAEICFCFSRS